MDEWNSKVHQKNGLIKRVKNSLYNEYRAENETILFLKKWVPNKISPICGSSVSQDRRFLFKYMPNLENYFHYRSIDVSTLKELAYRWNFKVYNKFKKKQSHKAIEDIYESVKELDFYRKNFLNIDKNCF